MISKDYKTKYVKYTYFPGVPQNNHEKKQISKINVCVIFLFAYVYASPPAKGPVGFNIFKYRRF